MNWPIDFVQPSLQLVAKYIEYFHCVSHFMKIHFFAIDLRRSTNSDNMGYSLGEQMKKINGGST